MENYTIENKGTIKLGDKVMVSDPCYGLNTWCQGVVENVLPGEYKCKVGFSDEGDWDTRVADIEVDSGQAGIYDYEYYKKYHILIRLNIKRR